MGSHFKPRTSDSRREAGSARRLGNRRRLRLRWSPRRVIPSGDTQQVSHPNSDVKVIDSNIPFVYLYLFILFLFFILFILYIFVYLR